jgi:hypothetical protein
MKFHEIDWRFSSTKRVLKALSAGMKNVDQQLQQAQASRYGLFDVDEANEQMEGLAGIAFLMAQTYIVGTVSDANKIARPSKPFRKVELLRRFSDNLPNSNVTKLELCDSIANYFKHHDEWVTRSETEHNKRTVDILHAVGIEESDEFPCLKAANLLFSHNSYDLEPLLLLISNWRQDVITASKERLKTN